MTQLSHTIQPFVSSPFVLTEQEHVAAILKEINWDAQRSERVHSKTLRYIQIIRDAKTGIGEVETFLQHYPLSSAEGRALMTLAEALLRIPDSETADALIAEKIGVSDWKKVAGSGFFGAASSIGLGVAKSMLGGFLSGVSRPVIRKATEETVRRLGAQFVVGETIESALKIAQSQSKSGERMSFDMLGEGARTAEDAERYFSAYIHAATVIGNANAADKSLMARHGMSVKLSALHPRYVWTQAVECVPAITQKLLALCKIAAEKGITLTVDAEESDRLEMSLDIIAHVAAAPELKGWDGFGLAVQAYERRSHAVIDYACHVARQTGQHLQVRLVKGAYWDGEIKRAQIAGVAQYPVFTRKIHTDLSYLRGVQKLLAARDCITPMFATHNAATAAAIMDLAGSDKTGFEIQRLFGMGQHLGDMLREQEKVPVTLYAPVGQYQDLLPYLVRRMLENGANTSFVSQIRDAAIPPEKLARDPVQFLRDEGRIHAARDIPLPSDIYGAGRRNSQGFDLSRIQDRDAFLSHVKLPAMGELQTVSIPESVARAQQAFVTWNNRPAHERAGLLRKSADVLENHTGALIALLQSEGKKTLNDAIAELREAVDFCRYYAEQGEIQFAATGHTLRGPTGEHNRLCLTGRGVFVAISPWNFPLAIFLGQVVAALMAGNTVLAKPAEQTPRIAAFTVRLLHQAGIPQDVVQLITGDGRVGAQLVAHTGIAGVTFTGSTDVARLINRALAAKDSAIVPLIAETGGQNAMIVDSTALPEQAVDDVIQSAFGSAGQRCSALRILYLQDDIADKVIHLLKGAMELLHVGRPNDIMTDIPPVIDVEARDKLRAHQLYLDSFARCAASAKPAQMDDNDTYITPCAYEIDSLSRLSAEVFGPILHIIRFPAGDIMRVVNDINAAGFGLTFGVHSRLESRHKLLATSIRAGNIYINRNMIGAVVGGQPFGGMGLSGTGPKAGGPHYLARFATEVTITDNIMATGGNIDLLSRIED